jgi:hypothetical protein
MQALSLIDLFKEDEALTGHFPGLPRQDTGPTPG